MPEPTEAQLLDDKFWENKYISGSRESLEADKALAIAELRALYQDTVISTRDDAGQRVYVLEQARLLRRLVDHYDELLKIPF